MLAMASNRTYGLNLDAGETMQPQPFSLVGDGAGSVFKVFTVAAASIWAWASAPNWTRRGRFEAKGLGSGGAKGCPPATWCVQNAAKLSRHDERHRRPGHLAEHRVRETHFAGRRAAHRRHGDQVGPAVLCAARHCPRLRPGEQREPRRLRQTAEPRLVHPRPDRGQRARTVERRRDPGSGGMWCPPNPIDKVFDRTRSGSFGHHRDL